MDQITELRTIFKVATYELHRDRAQMILMELENERLRRKAYQK